MPEQMLKVESWRPNGQVQGWFEDTWEVEGKKGE